MLTEAFNGCNEGVNNVVRDAMKHFTAAGVTVEEVSMPFHNQGNTWNITKSVTAVYSQYVDLFFLYENNTKTLFV